MIEGEVASSQDLIQYLKFKKKYNPTYINPTHDLYEAYVFAQDYKLPKKAIYIIFSSQTYVGFILLIAPLVSTPSNRKLLVH